MAKKGPKVDQNHQPVSSHIPPDFVFMNIILFVQSCIICVTAVMYGCLGWFPSCALTEHCAMKAYWGSGHITPDILDLGTR
jgi:hypothetical protein